MPRPPSFYHPLRDIRKLTDAKTQADFAKKIGVAAATIQAIENGKLDISRKLALRIERATGADHRELLKGATGKPISIDGKKFTRAFFDHWSERQNLAIDDGNSTNLDQLNFWTQILVRAAKRKPSESRVGSSVIHRITEALDSVCQDCELEAEVENLMTPLKKVEYHASAPDQWIDGASQPGKGLQAINRFHPSARVVVSVERIPRWAPGHPAPVSSETKD